MRHRFALGLLLLVITLGSAVPLRAYSPWRTWLHLGPVGQIEQTDAGLYFLAGTTLCRYDPSDPSSLRSLGREDGISEAQTSALIYAPEARTLVLYHPSGRIDLMRSGQIFTLTDLADSRSVRDRTLTSLQQQGTSAYVSGRFGLIELDLTSQSIRGTYLTGQDVQAAVLLSDRLYALVAGQILTAGRTSLLQDSRSWTPLSSASLTGRSFRQLVESSGLLYALTTEGQLCRLSADGSLTELAPRGRQSGWTAMSATTNGLALWFGNELVLLTADGTEELLQGLYTSGVSYLATNNSLWVAAGLDGLGRYTRSAEGTWQRNSQPVTLTSPAGDGHEQLRLIGGVLYSLDGARDLDRRYTAGVLQRFDGISWSQLPTSFGSVTYRDLLDIAPAPDGAEGHYFVSSWGDGLFELRGDSIVAGYTTRNSPLHTLHPGMTHQTRVGALTRDSRGLLFLAQGTGSDGPGIALRSIDSQGVWRAYDYPELRDVNAFGPMIAMSTGLKWLGEYARFSGPTGLFAFDDKGTESIEDDEHAHFTALQEPSGRAIPFGRIQALTLDHSGQLWVGMDTGYAYITQPTRLPAGGATPTAIRPTGGDRPPYYYLLSGISVTSIAVDGLDRKWLGTDGSGLYLVSPDGRQILAHYTEENSPLVSDRVTALAFDEARGRLYIGSSVGLSELDTQASAGSSTATPSAFAYPNPLRPGDPDIVTVAGLPAGASLRISDVSGRTLLETTTQESVWRWDTRSPQTGTLATGVYFITIFAPSGGAPQTLQVAIVRG